MNIEVSEIRDDFSEEIIAESSINETIEDFFTSSKGIRKRIFLRFSDTKGWDCEIRG
ncbi:MAG: hypothetical protein ACLFPQ_05570 [Candidatus Woesearchaeota archaeon]